MPAVLLRCSALPPELTARLRLNLGLARRQTTADQWEGVGVRIEALHDLKTTTISPKHTSRNVVSWNRPTPMMLRVD
jgi:hypothetical protein